MITIWLNCVITLISFLYRICWQKKTCGLCDGHHNATLHGTPGWRLHPSQCSTLTFEGSVRGSNLEPAARQKSDSSRHCECQAAWLRRGRFKGRSQIKQPLHTTASPALKMSLMYYIFRDRAILLDLPAHHLRIWMCVCIHTARIRSPLCSSLAHFAPLYHRARFLRS